MLSKLTNDLQEGDRVVLPEFDNGLELVPAQRAIVDYTSDDFVYARIIKSARVDKADDGLRELFRGNLPEELEVW